MTAGKHAGVPLCDLKAQYEPLRDKLEAAAVRVMSSGQVILGPEVTAFEQEVADYCGASHGIGCSSGTDALSLAIAGLDIGPGDEVILPTFTFFATAGSVCRAGAKPVFVDIDPVTFNLDPAQVESKITPRTKAIMAVHLFGQCADMAPLWQIAERNDLPIIEDVAQAMGAEYQNKRAGSLGLVGCLSFYPTKNLGGFGDAGMVVTSDPALAAKIACLRGHGMEPRYFHKYLGWNGRIDALQAALLRVKMPCLDLWITKRQEAGARYDAMIQDEHLTEYLTRPTLKPHRRHTYNQYVVRVGRNERDRLVKHLKSQNIGCEIYYPMPLHTQECLQHLGYRAGDFPASEEACRSVLALPMFPEITAEQQSRVIGSIAAFLRVPARRAA